MFASSMISDIIVEKKAPKFYYSANHLICIILKKITLPFFITKLINMR